ncbi:MAG: hypothetical protein R3D69_13855 [Xanthobacteraceae bacterium]
MRSRVSISFCEYGAKIAAAHRIMHVVGVALLAEKQMHAVSAAPAAPPASPEAG